MIRKLWYWFAKNILKFIDNNTFNTILFWINCKRLGHTFYSPDFKNPKSFNEKK